MAGCFIDTSLVPVGDAFAIEFTTTMTLIFLSFGVGLDPRQQKVFGPALAPGLVGLILGVCTFGTGFVRPGYSGVCKSHSRGLAMPMLLHDTNKRAGSCESCKMFRGVRRVEFSHLPLAALGRTLFSSGCPRLFLLRLPALLPSQGDRRLGDMTSQRGSFTCISYSTADDSTRECT